jgi:hypothetical protein
VGLVIRGASHLLHLTLVMTVAWDNVINLITSVSTCSSDKVYMDKSGLWQITFPISILLVLFPYSMITYHFRGFSKTKKC